MTTFVTGKSRWKYLAVFVVGMGFVLIVQNVVRTGPWCAGTNTLLNPTVSCSTREHYREEWDYELMRQEIIQKITTLQKEGTVTHMSVFFRDLQNGPRVGIQEDQMFHPASLLKLPLMIALLHEADLDPGLLDEEIVSPGTLPPVSNVDSNEAIQPNTSYTIRELLRRMIVYSDNNSADLLVLKVNSKPMPSNSNAFLDIGTMGIMSTGNIGRLSMQSYTNVFGLLYNAWYLSDTMSQLALTLLSKSTYKNGLVAGVPEGITVAHKFGFYNVPNEESELHDCGIVYHPRTPYVLCVMTIGPNIASEEKAISEISRVVYTNVDGM